jgi:hypothetical protein
MTKQKKQPLTLTKGILNYKEEAQAVTQKFDNEFSAFVEYYNTVNGTNLTRQEALVGSKLSGEILNLFFNITRMIERK